VPLPPLPLAPSLFSRTSLTSLTSPTFPISPSSPFRFASSGLSAHPNEEPQAEVPPCRPYLLEEDALQSHHPSVESRHEMPAFSVSSLALGVVPLQRPQEEQGDCRNLL